MMAKPVCLVAGVGPGMGLAIARRFGREGFAVAMIARNADSLARAAAQLAEEDIVASAHSADLSRPDEVAHACRTIADRNGHPQVAVYNAAVWREADVATMDPTLFNQDLSLGITGAMVVAQAVLPAMHEAGAGTLLFTGGGLALAPAYGAAVPSLVAAKAGLRGWVHALHAAMAGSPIRVGTVTIAGMVAPGTAFEPELIADRYWTMHQDREGPAEIVFDGR